MNNNNASTDALTMLFGYNYQVLKRNLADISHEESLLQPEGGGNCLNWVLGHIVATRNGALQMLQQEPVWSEDEVNTYKRGSAPIRDGSQALSFEKIVAALDSSQDRLVAGLSGASEEQLSADAGDKAPEDTVGKTLFVLQFHEAYHAGQTGLLRRMSGHAGAIS